MSMAFKYIYTSNKPYSLVPQTLKCTSSSKEVPTGDDTVENYMA